MTADWSVRVNRSKFGSVTTPLFNFISVHLPSSSQLSPKPSHLLFPAYAGFPTSGRSSSCFSPGVDPHLQTMPFFKVEVKALVAQSCLTLCDPMDCSPPGSPVHGILQAGRQEWVATPFSRKYSPPRDQTQVSSTAGRFFII